MPRSGHVTAGPILATRHTDPFHRSSTYQPGRRHPAAHLTSRDNRLRQIGGSGAAGTAEAGVSYHPKPGTWNTPTAITASDPRVPAENPSVRLNSRASRAW